MPPASSACATPHPGDRRENRCLEASKVELCSRLNPSKKKEKRESWQNMSLRRPAEPLLLRGVGSATGAGKSTPQRKPCPHAGRTGEQTLCQGAIAGFSCDAARRRGLTSTCCRGELVRGVSLRETSFLVRPCVLISESRVRSILALRPSFHVATLNCDWGQTLPQF